MYNLKPVDLNIKLHVVVCWEEAREKGLLHQLFLLVPKV